MSRRPPHPLPLARITTALRRLTARRPWLRWLPLATTTTALVLSVGSYQSRADAARRAWSDTVEVWVADQPLGAGDPVSADGATVAAVMVPEGALPGGRPPTGRVVRRVAAGAVLTDLDVTHDDPSTALIPDGWRGVAVVEVTPSGASVGDRVDVVADGVVIASDAVVADTGVDPGTGVLLAVPADVAPLVALADDTGIRLLRRP